jgi:hypothetical protein
MATVSGVLLARTTSARSLRALVVARDANLKNAPTRSRHPIAFA